MAVAGNTTPVNLNVNEPDGSVIQVRQLDDYQREGRVAVSDYLARSHVAFGDPKAGEMLPGTAAPYVGTQAQVNALVDDDWEGRIGYASDNRDLFTWTDRGGTVVQEQLYPLYNSIASLPWSFETQLPVAYADIESSVGTPAVVTFVQSKSTESPPLTAEIFAHIPVLNTTGTVRSCAFKLRYAIDAGAYADVVGGRPLDTMKLLGNQAGKMILRGVQTLTPIPGANQTWRWRIQGKCTSALDVTANSAAIYAGEASISVLHVRIFRP